jgi:hypothetical protein
MTFSLREMVEKQMVPSECASQELSNEWYVVTTILNLGGNFCVAPLVTDHQSLKSAS